MARLDPGCAARQRLEGQCRKEIDPNPAEPEVSSIWWEVIAFFMEGFALYGAALHPTAAMPLHAMLVAEKHSQPHADDREPAQNGERDLVESSDNVVTLVRVWARDAQAEHRWTWLRSLGETWTVLSMRVRREREIKRAVAALGELDDRTLRDLGIFGQSDIERMVRYCRDC